MNAKAEKFVCSSRDILGWVFKILGSVAFVVLIWYGGKPLANEKRITQTEECVRKVEVKVDDTVEKVREIDRKLEDLKTQQQTVKESVIRMEEMTKYLYHQAKKTGE